MLHFCLTPRGDGTRSVESARVIMLIAGGILNLVRQEGRSPRNPELDTMAPKAPLFPRIASTKAIAPKKKSNLLTKSLGFLMDDAPDAPAPLGNAPIDYECLKIMIRDRVIGALFNYLGSQHELTDEKRGEIESLIRYPKQASLAPDADTRYAGLKMLFDIRVRVPGNASSEPHLSWLGESHAYGVPSWMVRLSVIEPLLDTISR